jgi:16S rRNA processing protein RimM
VAGPGCICVGVITKPVGVRGYVKIRAFTETADSFLKIKKVFLEDGVTLQLLDPMVKTPSILIVKVCNDRTAAELFRGKRLFAYPSDFQPLDDGEYYLETLVGMTAVNESGDAVGRVSATFDFGAGAFLDITLSNSNEVVTIQFNSMAILDVNIEDGVIRLDDRFILR